MSRERNLVRDTSFHLSPADRRVLSVAFDADAMEELLSWYQDAAERQATLDEFLDLAKQAERGEIVITGFGYVENDETGEADHPQVRAAVSRIAEGVQLRRSIDREKK